MRKNTTSLLVLSALMCALIAILSQVQFPLPPVPVSLSLLGVHLCGALLPGRWGAASVAAYVLLGATGVPVYAGFAGGPSALFGPTGGYLIGYIFCAALEARILRRTGFGARALALSMVAGTLACYALGCAWFSLSSGSALGRSFALCVFPFLPGDVLKIALAASLVRRLRPSLCALGLYA